MHCYVRIIYVHIVQILNVPSSHKSILEGKMATDCMFNYIFRMISPVSHNLLYQICVTFLFLKISLKLIWKYEKNELPFLPRFCYIS